MATLAKSVYIDGVYLLFKDGDSGFDKLRAR